MKLKNIVLICTSSISLILIAAPDCLDNSWHMQKEGDLKDYHKVNCTCPCGSFTPNRDYQLLADRNMCFTCKHYHNPRPLPIKRSYLFSSVDTHSTDMATTNTHSTHLKYVATLLQKKLHPRGKKLRRLFSK